ncbi:MAG TPA: molybdopterin-guanine dinucleotide biosynthesis protein B [Alphaproteobacteria bacterium]|nr:molybdopterin-guanine dinucleotide biosynthesis protein B [Alphaproteobacteria bacterium]
MKLFGLAGWSGSGKTTLVQGLLPELGRRGLTVSTIKHAHHSFDVDQPGKDSYEHRRAGAAEVLVSSSARWALMHELRGAAEPSLDELVARLAPVDLVIVEGFKGHVHDKLEVHRAALAKPLICREDPAVVAVASDGPIPGLRLPLFDINDIAAIAGFIVAHTGLGERARGVA